VLLLLNNGNNNLKGLKRAMDMALPMLRKTVTMAPPRKGQRGVFALAASETQSEFAWQPSLTDSQMWSERSWTSTSRELHGPLSPRKSGGFADGSSGALAPAGWAMTPMAEVSQEKRGRQSRDAKELVEAKRALLGAVPGDWDAQSFVHFKNKFMAEGRWLAVPGLTAAALKASQAAMAAGSYIVPSNRQKKVHLPHRPVVTWLGLDSLEESDVPAGHHPPPLVVSASTPLEAAFVAARAFKGHPIVVTLEATDFAKPTKGHGLGDGRLLEGSEARMIAQQEMFLCTNFELHSRMATTFCSKETPQDRLTAHHQPSIFAAERVCLFRGPAAQGYPFLPQEEQAALTVLVSGRAVKRPYMTPKVELFQAKEDLISFQNRLNMLTHRALQAAEPKKRPVLVISACGLLDAENRQPRLGMANALRTWRSMYANSFEAVIVACGEHQTALFMDKVINIDVYTSILNNSTVHPSPLQWHWNMPILNLSNNPVLGHVGSRMDVQRMGPSSDPSAKKAAPRKISGGGRRMSNAQHLQHMSSLVGEAHINPGFSRGPSPFFSTLSRPTSTASLQPVPGPVAAAHQLPTSAADQPGILPFKRRISACNITAGGQVEDSRTHVARSTQIRLEQMDQQRQDTVNEISSNAVSLFAQLGQKAADKRDGIVPPPPLFAQAHVMTSERKRQIDAVAALFEMPAELRNHTFKAIEKGSKLTAEDAEDPSSPKGKAVPKSLTMSTLAAGENGPEAAEGGDRDEDEEESEGAGGAESAGHEAFRIFEEVRSLASSLDSKLRESSRKTKTIVVSASGWRSTSPVYGSGAQTARSLPLPKI